MTPDEARLVLAKRQEARAELRAREAARESIAAWCEYGPPTERGAMVLERWQRDLIGRVERVAAEWDALPDGPKPVWICNIDAPPQSGKSEAAKRIVSHLMAARGWSIGYATYGASLAEAHSARVRGLMRSPEAIRVWPYLAGGKGRRDDALKDTAAEWSIPSPTTSRMGPRLMARGRDGALTGRTMDAIILDDLYKDAGDYASPAARKEVDGFLRSAVLARLMERGGLLWNIGTRWGIADVRGWIDDRAEELRAAGLNPRIETWSYPLRAVPGDVMGRAPGEYLTDRWDEAKEAAARIFYGRHAAAILDGRPAPDGGAIFKREWFAQRYRGSPDAQRAACEVVASIDPASTSGGGDHSVVDVWGFKGADAYLLAKVRGQWGYVELRQAVRDVRERWRPAAVVVEETSNGRAIINELRGEVPGLMPMGHLGKAKSVRWDAQSPRLYAGQVWFPESVHAPWMLDYTERMVMLTGVGEEVDDDADAWEMAMRWRGERAMGVVRLGGIPGLT